MIAPSVLRTSPPNTTIKTWDAYSMVKSSDLGENGYALREQWSSRASVFLARIETQSASGEELRRRRTLMPGILDKAFKGEL